MVIYKDSIDKISELLELFFRKSNNEKPMIDKLAYEFLILLDTISLVRSLLIDTMFFRDRRYLLLNYASSTHVENDGWHNTQLFLQLEGSTKDFIGVRIFSFG